MGQSNGQAEIKAILEEYLSIVTDELGKGLIEALLAYRKQHELELLDRVRDRIIEEGESNYTLHSIIKAERERLSS